MLSSRESLTHTFIRPHPSLLPSSLGEAKRPPLVHPSPCARDCPQKPGPSLSDLVSPSAVLSPPGLPPSPEEGCQNPPGLPLLQPQSTSPPSAMQDQSPLSESLPCGLTLPPSSFLPGFHDTTLSGVPALDTPSQAPSLAPLPLSPHQCRCCLGRGLLLSAPAGLSA